MDDALTTSHRAGQEHRPTTKRAASDRGKCYGSAYSYHYPRQQGRHRPKIDLRKQVEEQSPKGSAPPTMVPTLPPGPQWIHIGGTEGKVSRPDDLDMWYGTAKEYHRPRQQ
eukprot:496392-Karenia_brevis.AAC.1